MSTPGASTTEKKKEKANKMLALMKKFLKMNENTAVLLL